MPNRLRTYFQSLDSGDHVVQAVIHEVSSGWVAAIRIDHCSGPEDAAAVNDALAADFRDIVTMATGAPAPNDSIKSGFDLKPPAGWVAASILGAFPSREKAEEIVPYLHQYCILLVTPAEV